MKYASITVALKKGWPIVCAVIMFALFWTVQQAFAGDASVKQGERLVTIYDNGQEQTIVTRATTVREVLREAEVELSDIDITEPAVETEISGRQYNVNVYRARPVVVEDGAQRARVMTAAQGPVQIAKAAKVTLYSEDDTKMERVDDVLADGGAGLKMIIERATPFEFVLYGKPVEARTQAKTVGEMLKEKNVQLGPDDGVSPAEDTPITAGMKVSVWRNGVQTVTIEEKVTMPVRQITDMDKPIGYRFVKEEGRNGKKQVTYVIEMRNGKEVKRKQIQSVVTEKPIEQVEIVGAKTPIGGLTKSQGVLHFTDSRGVTHRETYYDLPMSRVMTNCGGGGYYTVRSDGAKVDRDGHVIIAANLGRYPRCSIVETSLGSGKVYDTGGFASVHPDGFDLATDWTKADGI